MIRAMMIAILMAGALPVMAVAQGSAKRSAEAQALADRAEAATTAKRYDEAIGYYNQALRLNPGDTIWLMYRAMAKERSGQCPSALVDFAQVERARPNRETLAVLYAIRSQCHIKMKNDPALIADLSAQVRLEPNDVYAWTELGRTYDRNGQSDKAEAALRRAVQVAPNDADAHFGLAMVLMGLHREREAAPHMREVVRLRPDDIQAKRFLRAFEQGYAPSARGSSGAPVTARPAGGGIANSGVNFGASIEAVRQSLAGRTIQFLPATYNNGWYRPAANGEFSDIDPRLVRFNYEFDGPAGPAAKLIGLVLTYKRDSAAQSAVYRERVSTLSKRYPLAAKSPTAMEADVAGTVISVIDDTMWGQVYEIYRKAGTVSAPAPKPAAGVPSKENCQAVTVVHLPIRKRDKVVTFFASPAIDSLRYNWTVEYGTILSGQGTPSITVAVAIPGGGLELAAHVELEADPSCPNRERADRDSVITH